MTMSSKTVEQLYEELRPITMLIASQRSTFINWGQTFVCQPLAIFEPVTTRHCQLVLELARREGKTVRAVGVGHSPSDLACTNGYMLRMEKFCRILEINSDKEFFIAEAGVTLNVLHQALARFNLAMINVGSISDQTVAGIVTTATHGTGINFGVISSSVMALTLLLADGKMVRCSRTERPDLFMASICGLGSTGLILTIQMEVQRAFHLKEVSQTLSLDAIVKDLDRIVHSSEHVRMWWYPATRHARLSGADRTTEAKRPVQVSWFRDGLLAYHGMIALLFLGRYLQYFNIIASRLSTWLAPQRTVGVNESHVIFNLDCRCPQHTTEWAIPYENSRECILELQSWFDAEYARPSGLRPHALVEIRFSSADDIWLSPSSGQRTCWIGIVIFKPYGFNVPYRQLFAAFEGILSKYQGRPHWAKAHHLRPHQLRQLYPRFDDFIRVIEQADPTGIFRNAYINRHLFGVTDASTDERIHKAYQRTIG